MKSLDEKALFFKAFGEQIRLKIVEYLIEQESCKCICHLSDHVKRDQSVVFRHVKILEEAGIVQTSKVKKNLMCCIKDKDKIRKLLEVYS